ncbi:37S ribosomal protein S5 [Poronia punctata]|nr:37S ribosomal protein S5 [Poronia punctata]
MSVARPIRCLLPRGLAATSSKAGVAAATPRIIPRCHAPFHSSANLSKRRSRFKSIRAEAMGLTSPEKVQEFTKKAFPDYTPEELDVLRTRYTPEQMAAIEAGEAAIDPKDLTIQGRLRIDPYRSPYLDDFSRILPIVDKRPKLHPAPPAKLEPMALLDEEEALKNAAYESVPKNLNIEGLSGEQLEKALANVDESLAQTKFIEDGPMFKNQPPTNSALAPELGKDLFGVKGHYSKPNDPADEGMDPNGQFQDLKARTGMRMRDIVELSKFTKVIVRRRVVNQTRLGKVRKMWILAICGTGNGRIGVGEASAVEPDDAKTKASQLAIANMLPIRRYENRTIYGKVSAKVGATVVQLESRPPGFGLRASHRLFEIFRAVGIHDISAKMPRGRNPMNSVKACIQALTSQRDPEEIAIGRGKKLVDVRKVYYGGNTL